MKITFPAALGLLFTALKLTNHIDWSWWLVLLPFYAPLAFFVIIAILGGICGLFYVKTETPAARAARLMRDMERQISQQNKRR